VKQVLKGVVAAMIVCVPLGLNLHLWLHATPPVTILIAGGLALAIIVVVGTRSDQADATADEAWRAAAPDLPPVSDRRSMEAAQQQLPGPDAAGRKAPSVPAAKSPARKGGSGR